MDWLREESPQEAQERLHLVARYAQVGQCVSSVAHDVNNYLGAIMAYAELIGLEESLGADTRRMLDEIIGAVRKASGLMGNLTDVARKDRKDIRIVNPEQLIDRALDIRRYDIKVGGVSLETDYEQGLGAIAIDLPRTQQAIMSLLSNAIEAMENEKTRKIWVSARTFDNMVELSFRDSGQPISESLQDSMFEPFFTTKGGLHLGLGLPAARAVAQQQQGTLTYEPERGFVFRLPAKSKPGSFTQ